MYTRARVHTRHTHTHTFMSVQRQASPRREIRTRIGRASLAGIDPGALIETPTPSLCGYRKHSPHTRTRDLPYANIADLPPPPRRSLLPAAPFRAAVCTPSRKAAVHVGSEGACSFSVACSFPYVFLTAVSLRRLSYARNYLSRRTNSRRLSHLREIVDSAESREEIVRRERRRRSCGLFRTRDVERQYEE